jgi:hypothetical protein
MYASKDVKPSRIKEKYIYNGFSVTGRLLRVEIITDNVKYVLCGVCDVTTTNISAIVAFNPF